MLGGSLNRPFHQASASVVNPPPSHSSSIDINYSPKHARKPTLFASNRNMKNLSLNFAYPSPQPSSNYTTTLLSPASDLPFNKPSLPRRKTLTLSIPSNEITTVLLVPSKDPAPALVTPAVTKTPLVPPYVPRPRGRPSPATDSDAITTALTEPPKHPYAYYDYGAATPVSSSSSTSTSTATAKSAVHPDQNHTTPQIALSKKYLLPEELQESNQLNAYPTGPRNVYNNTIFLYLDPTFNPDTKKPRGLVGQVDINAYDLVINVAKECQDLSSQFTNQIPGRKEYLYVPWSHTSSISRDLPSLTAKIQQFSDQGLKILVHCQCGVSRSACVIVAFFMQKFSIGVNEAYELLKSGTEVDVPGGVNKMIGDKGNNIDACDRICPNMSLIFELMEFGDFLSGVSKKEVM
ncbi:DSPc-domain-containing protein [Suhomyces tanzawaensis NRRL Y-17324]|uniref:protein-tyrosine-phosphatase n=1 Tax=Suhomyces tanzawaensis NRRL Y-17324 TaxID=984487 RepID=A0A1E4SBH2_9ASCO|nr:DSPc-domain-containing protein [Suhomyces tanzawaensis NRRL Y-17324]ODV76877.1 DSPc-domain-containing protein [Suhomyces tanzawaensis NRRL Y-17324]